MRESPDILIRKLRREREALLEQLTSRRGGAEWCLAHTAIVDSVVKAVHAGLRADGIAVIATGGYGRRELAPYSDVDLAVVPLDESAPATESQVKELFQRLHAWIQDELALQIGYSFRLIADAPSLDVKSRTGLLDSRLVCGSADAFEALNQSLTASFPVGEFLIAKIEERKRALAKWHDTPLVVEPELKEGAGGLRDHQTAVWIARAIGATAPPNGDSLDLLLAARNALQFAAGRYVNVLTRQKQADISDLWQCDMKELSSSIAGAMLNMEEEFRQTLEAIHETRFTISHGVEASHGRARIARTATLSEAAVGLAHAAKLGLGIPKSSSMRVKVNGPEALYALSTGGATLHALDRSGILERLIPELTRCRTLMPSDSAHEYTVFEHTMRVVRNLDGLAPGGFLGDVLSGIASPEIVYLAALLHDAGKAVPNERHSESGERLARDLCARWELGEKVSHSVAWLVRNHLLINEYIRMRDVLNPATAGELARLVETKERLDMLLVLTWADVSAVYEGAWTAAQEHLLRELYERTRANIEHEGPDPADATTYRKKLMRELKLEKTPHEEVEAFVKSLPAHYLVSTPPDLVRLHIQLERKAREGKATVELFDQIDLGATEVTVCCPDAPGLLSDLLGVIYAHDLSMHGLRASTTHTAKPVALDVFTVSFAGRPVPEATARAFSQDMRMVVEGMMQVDDLLRRHSKDPGRDQEMFTYRFLPGIPAILEVQAPKGRGMAYRLSRLIARQEWNIEAARVGQWAGKGTAAFYISRDNQPIDPAEVDRALGGAG